MFILRCAQAPENLVRNRVVLFDSFLRRINISHDRRTLMRVDVYVRGLGPTVSELDVSQHKVFSKTCFSMMVPEVQQHIKNLTGLRSVILCGIETQACIQQTALDLMEHDYDVHIIVDACSSRSMVDRIYAFERLREAGAFLTTSESMMLALTGDAASSGFKQVQKLIREPAPDSGLLS